MVGPAFLLAVLGCSGEASHDSADSGFSFGDFGTYDPSFQDLTWTFLDARQSGGDFQLSISDGDGLTDCGLAADFDARPAFPARQLFVAFRDLNYQDCPTGLFTLGTCDHENQDVLGSDCARYRAWDPDGTPVADINATSGAMQVTDDGTRCTIELELAFPGGTFSETRAIPYGNGPGPACKQ